MAEHVQRPGDPIEPEVIDDRAAAREARGHLDTARLLARLLDNLVPIPGTSYRIGLDPLLGLVPGAGDLVGAVLSTWILVAASRLGAPASVLARMALNVAIDAVVGAVPFAGDLFDAGWKANLRNVRLMEAWLARPGPTRRANGAFVALLVLAVLLVVAAVGWAGWQLVAWAVRGAGAG
jgi:hypothetical protein